MAQSFSINNILITVPMKKLTDGLEQTIRSCEVCGKLNPLPSLEGSCKNCKILCKSLNKYAQANIPAKFWNLQMEKHFTGDQVLMEQYKKITEDLKKNYIGGTSICFTGAHGVGKTFCVCSILKRALWKDYSALYINLHDIVGALIDGKQEERSQARRDLLLVDWLVIDEFDVRFLLSSKTSDLFAKVLEDIFRTRSQNNLPTLMCSNSPNVIEGFNGSFKNSIDSLMSTMTMVAVLGSDFRKESK